MLKGKLICRGRHAFTLIEVLVVVAIIALLIAILLPSLNRARDQAKTVQCLGNMKQIGMTMNFYLADTGGKYIPPFRYPITWKYKHNSNSYKDPYWFQYLPFKYLANQHEVAKCPSDTTAASAAKNRSGFPDLGGGAPRITYSYAMNDTLPTSKVATYQAMAALGLLQDTTIRYNPTLISRLKRPSDIIYMFETAGHNIMSGESPLWEYRLDHGGRKERMSFLFADGHGESRDFFTMWPGDRTTGALKNVFDWPGRFRQLWLGDSKATGRILY